MRTFQSRSHDDTPMNDLTMQGDIFFYNGHPVPTTDQEFLLQSD